MSEYLRVNLKPAPFPGAFAEAFVPSYKAPRCVRRGCTRKHFECDVCGKYRHDLPHTNDHIAWCHICQVRPEEF